MTEKEYINSIKKVSEKRNYRITNSYGVKDAYKYYRNHNGKINLPVFRKIISAVNMKLQDKIVNGEDVHFPERMGYMELRKYDTKLSIVDGKVKSNFPINWNETLKLWNTDKEAEKNKTLVRFEVPQVFKVLYKRTYANYKNKMYFELKTNRLLRSRLKDNILNNKVDAFTLKKRHYGTKNN